MDIHSLNRDGFNILRPSIVQYVSFVFSFVSFLGLAYWYYSYKFTYWRRRGIKGPIPWTPFGNIIDDLKLGMRKHDLHQVNKYGKISGIYITTTPVLVVTDPELIKEIQVTKFMHLSGANFEMGHKIMKKVSSFTSGNDWKKMRSIISPTFASGKMKAMMPMINESCDLLEQVVQKWINSDTHGVVDTKMVFGNFTMDVIAKCAFATKINCQEEEGEFQVHARGFFNISLATSGVMQFLPQFIKDYFQMTPMPAEHIAYLTGICKEVIRKRKGESFMSKGGKHNDFIALILESKEEMTEDEMLGSALVLLIAGYETTATLMTYMAYALAKHPAIQEKLIQEIDALEKVDYESIFKMEYLDAVMCETLRMYPPVLRVERRAMEEVTLSNGLTIEKDFGIRFPIYALHHDPELFPEPEVFQPERFLPENKDYLIPFSWIPFMDGPRNCVGRRFAEMETKLCFTRFLQKFKFIECSRTEPALEYKDIAIMLAAKSVTVQIVKRV